MENGLETRLKSAEILFVDVDGVLTDGSLHVLEDGSQFRTFHVRDGLGMQLLVRADIKVAIVSAGSSSAVEHRARRLRLNHVFQGVADKAKLVDQFLTETNLNPSNAAFMGDDLTDLAAMRHVGLALSVPEAHPRVLEVAHYTTRAPGGRGAVREVCELILRHNNVDPETLLAK